MLVELHSHTHHSHGTKVLYDGTGTPEEMVRAAKQLGLGAMAITDHNHMKGVKEAVRAGKKHNIVVIPGEEVTSYDGHVLALGINKPIQPGMTIEKTVDKIHEQGGIAISAHPFDIKHEGLREKAKLCDAMEIFNANNLDRMSNNKAKKFASLNKLIGTAGSDAHHTSMIGHGLIEMNSKDINDADGILRAVKKGKFTVHAQYPSVRMVLDMALARLRMSYDYTFNYIENNYSFPKKQTARKLLRLAMHDGKIQYLFRGMAYASFASVLGYSAIKHAIGK